MSIRTIALLALLTIASLPVWAQDPRYENRGYGDDGVVECRSSNYAFQRCPVPWRNARLIRQLSDTQCVRGMNWGVDRGGIWVDRGCSGQFAAHDGGRGYGGGWYPPPGWDQRFEIRCESRDYQYNFCAVDLGGGGRASLADQRSNSPCILGQTWGWNRAGVWVAQGCAGVFMIDRRWR